MPNNVINKVVYGDRTLIDLTDTTADAADVASGKYFYAKDGVKTLGTGSIGSDNGDVYQDEEGYIVLKPGAGTNVSVTPLSVTENGVYSAPTGVAYSPVSVDVGPARSLSDITVSGSIVSGPAGLYSEAFNKAVSAGSAAVKGGNAANIYPTITFNSATGIFSTASATMEFTIGTNSTTFSAGYFSSYVDISSSVFKVPLMSSTYSLTTRSAADMTVNGSYVTAPSGYYSQAFSKAVSAGSARIAGNDFNYNEIIYYKSSLGIVYTTSYSYTFDISAPSNTFRSGYFSSNTDIINSSFSISIRSSSVQLPSLAAQTFTPASTTQYISSYQWLTGSQTILGDANLLSSNIKSGVSIFGVNGTVRDEDDLPTIYATWDDSIGYIYSCNYTYSQMVSMLVALDGDPLVGEVHDIWDNSGTIISFRYGGYWIIDYNTDDPIFRTLYNGPGKYRYYSDGSFEYIDLGQSKDVTPSRYAQNVYPDSPYEYLYQVTVSGDNNLISSNIRSGISIFGVEGTYTSPDTAGIFIERTNTTVNVYSNSAVSMIGRYAFAGGISIYSINFPNVTLIDDYAFYNNARTSNYSLPNVVSVGNSAFYSAWIRRIDLPECTYVGSNAFTFCSSVNSINMPKLVTANTGAFAYGLYYLGQNSTIEFPELILSNVDQRVFAGCRMYSISLPKCSIIPSGTFSGCSYLQSAYIPECTSIGPYAFHNCSSYGFSYVEYSKCTIIYDSAFYSCKSLTGISFPEVLSIGNHAFGNCIKLESVYAPKCISLGIGAFNSCSLLSEINLPSLETLGGFQYCTNLTSINFQNVTSTTGNVFMGCSNLSVAILPKLSIVTSDVFAYTTSILATYNLHTLYLSDCNYIYSYAFRYCMSLSSLYLLGSSIITLNHTNAFTSTPISTMASTTTFNIEAITASIPPRNIIWTPAATFASSLRGSPTVFSIYYDVSSAGNYSYDATVLVLAFNNDGVWTETNWVGGSGTKANDDHWANFLPAYSGTKTINITQIPLSASQVRFGLYNNGAIFSCSMASLSAIARVSTFGSIFVPASLYASYKAATNWTTYSSRFVSMTDAEIETFLSTLT